MRRSTKSVLLFGLLVLLVNLPPVLATVQSARVARFGVVTTADVVAGQVAGSAASKTYWLDFRLPAEIDPDRVVRPARVDRDTYAEAQLSRELEVRVLKDRPSAYHVTGEVRSNVGWWVILGLDALILVGFLLIKRVRRHGSPDVVRLEALGPVVAVADDPEGVRPSDDAIRGVVVAASADDVLLEVGDQRYLVVLDGHPVEVGVGELAQVRARLLG